MIDCDALVVGGGPAGSTCARILNRAGWNVIVADRAVFPRDKVCAGWLTPRVFTLLDLRPDDYRATGLTLEPIHAFRTGVIGSDLVETRYDRTVSYAIRRCEFDDFLLRRSGAPVMHRTSVDSMLRDHRAVVWIVNDAIRTPVVIGAGGHFCPVARYLRGGVDSSQPVIAQEAEFLSENDGRSERAPELIFCRDMDGYGWCVRKGSYLNVGIGRRSRENFADHVAGFIRYLADTGAIDGRDAARIKLKGHAYFAAGVGPRPLVGPGILLTGDAAGLAYPESGEGICPAVESGRLAAETLISASGTFSREALQPYADAIERTHPAVRRRSPGVRSTSAAAGRLLLRSRLFTRRILLDRWFLRRTASPACLEPAHPR